MNINKKVYEILKSAYIYPELWKEVVSPPKKLYAVGNISLLNMNSIAIVGSRNSSEYGEAITKKIAKDLAMENIVIVSGMALGIDSVAHKACIESGGKTIAILGSGFNHIYPKENEKLFLDIIQNDGLVISEFPLDSPVQMKNFPKRNRIISGLALGVLVIEAAYRSGTSITARFARAQGKKVFCIPNSIGNKNSYGTIDLVRKGAMLVRSAEDILVELNLKANLGKKGTIENNLKSKKSSKQLKILDENSKKIVDCIAQNKGLDAEKICIKTNLDVVTVNQLLTILEIDEVIVDTGKNGYDLVEAYYE